MVTPVSVPPTAAVMPVPATSGIIELLLFQTIQGQQAMQQMQMQYMLGQGQASGLPLPSTMPMTATVMRPALLPSQSAPTSPLKLAIPNVPLGRFAARYGLSCDDVDRLEKLGYKPGLPHIVNVSDKHWGDKGVKFTVVGWMEILEIHNKFLRDVKNGLWAE